jgi:hypothetical protein
MLKEPNYNHPEWKKISLVVKTRDNFRCVRCGSNDELHAHHLRYGNGEIWEVPLDWLTTLCRECHLNFVHTAEWTQTIDQFEGDFISRLLECLKTQFPTAKRNNKSTIIIPGSNAKHKPFISFASTYEHINYSKIKVLVYTPFAKVEDIIDVNTMTFKLPALMGLWDVERQNLASKKPFGPGFSSDQAKVTCIYKPTIVRCDLTLKPEEEFISIRVAIKLLLEEFGQ